MRQHHLGEDGDDLPADHVRRDAYLCVRQPTLYQVANNTESARRQYDLRGRAVAWPADQIIVIDIDQGSPVPPLPTWKASNGWSPRCPWDGPGTCSAWNAPGWPATTPTGTRCCGCVPSTTLICDEDGLYDPATINDRLLLGLKGTVSEAELHFIRARLQGGLLANAASGELAVRLPTGLVYDPAGDVVLDPDGGVLGAITHLFSTFRATRSATATVKAFAADALPFPARHLRVSEADRTAFPLRDRDDPGVRRSATLAGRPASSWGWEEVWGTMRGFGHSLISIR